MWWPTIVGAVITGSIALFGIIYNNVNSTRKMQAEQQKFVNDLFAKLDKQSELSDSRLEAKFDKSQAVTDAKLDELTREVREHNNFARRVPVIEEQIKVVNHRLDDLERA